jgi:hypothetical protein
VRLTADIEDLKNADSPLALIQNNNEDLVDQLYESLI